MQLIFEVSGYPDLSANATKLPNAGGPALSGLNAGDGFAAESVAAEMSHQRWAGDPVTAVDALGEPMVAAAIANHEIRRRLVARHGDFQTGGQQRRFQPNSCTVGILRFSRPEPETDRNAAPVAMTFRSLPSPGATARSRSLCRNCCWPAFTCVPLRRSNGTATRPCPYSG